MDASISIIIPIYNAGKYIEECCRSVLECISEQDELIVIDDGSTDNSATICDRLFENLNNAYVIRKSNGGVSSARNHGIELAKNEWILFIDADDKLFANAITEYRRIIENDSEWIIGGFTANECASNRSGNTYTITSDTLMRTILCEATNIDAFPKGSRYPGMNLWPCWGKLYRTDVIKDNNIRFSRDLILGEDLLFNFQYAKKISKASFVDRELYFYRISTSSVTANFQARRITNTLALCSKLKSEIGNENSMQLDYYRFVSLRAITCYELYFSNPQFKGSNKERKDEFRTFLNNEMISDAVRNSHGWDLTVGKFQKVKYGIELFLIKHKLIDVLLAGKSR